MSVACELGANNPRNAQALTWLPPVEPFAAVACMGAPLNGHAILGLRGGGPGPDSHQAAASGSPYRS